MKRKRGVNIQPTSHNILKFMFDQEAYSYQMLVSMKKAGETEQGQGRK